MTRKEHAELKHLEAQLAFAQDQINVLRRQAEYLRRRPDWFVTILQGKVPMARNPVQDLLIASLVELYRTQPGAFTPEAVARSLENQAKTIELATTFN